MSSLRPHQPPKPSVIIVGAGIGGLMLALLLERIHVPYRVFERAAEVKPLGSAITLDATILPVFEQLGLLDSLLNIALPYQKVEFFSDKMKRLGDMDFSGHQKLLGYANHVVTRARMYELLLGQIPAHHISFGINVVRTEEHHGRVHIYCSDNTKYEADLLVGSDGAFSTIRQSLYNRLDDLGLLPKVDSENVDAGHVNVIGVTVPRDSDKYPQLKDKFSHLTSTLDPKGERAWSTITVSGHQICWQLVARLSASDSKAQQFHNPEWEPESIEVVCKDFEDSPCPLGGTMGDIINDTPKLQISKVYLRERVFKTWYHGRTVLIGDACHTMIPGAGIGAIHALHDAVVLANSIYSMKDSSLQSITSAFEEYYAQRHHSLESHFKRSKTWMLTGQSPSGRVLSQHPALSPSSTGAVIAAVTASSAAAAAAASTGAM
ncbi:hypothetical protein B0O80DRAFT_489067 [Mortierella sp. GBAus27b]|nr:hypothetical protein B0O80DRAFT_489067 [Mortierella sp. GBAus27b]